MEKDYIDRFKEVADGLGLSHTIAEKIANFIHYEIQAAVRKERQACEMSNSINNASTH